MSEKEIALTVSQTEQGQSTEALDLDYTTPIYGMTRERINHLLTLVSAVNDRVDAFARLNIGHDGAEIVVSVFFSYPGGPMGKREESFFFFRARDGVGVEDEDGMWIYYSDINLERAEDFMKKLLFLAEENPRYRRLSA